MADTLGAGWALDWIKKTAAVVNAQREELTDLDRAIGDGDHGANLDRGFQAVLVKLDGATPATAGEVLKTVATTLISTVGGASGALYGTAFLRASKLGDSDLDAAGVVALLQAGVDGIVQRGKASVGEKTMVDAWTPALAAGNEAVAAGKSPAEVLDAMAVAAQEGAVATEPLVATKGRASYLGERSAGHRDPGAQSTAYVLRAAADAAAAA
ncbi:dihydroxyacetone kinase subunit DhaL [Propionicicella superfundia]|uniref:dihydroxyacetone kinase subunit DhaL n=1 Tax=Propionicicella superfundia TaxID=348582 RepID=UPI000412B71C|nr:dihydroxyacetone kinase subunit DhaL [Propionicicella superfundia]